MTDTTSEAETIGGHISDPAEKLTNPLRWRNMARWIARCNAYDIATVVLLGGLAIIAVCTFRDYAISNDEGVQHHYGELIIAYYRSGFADQSVFHFENLYLYGGLFDIIAVALSHLLPMDPYDLRHIMCALIGLGGIGAAAATARLIAGPRAGLMTLVALAVCGAWYGAMFNHTKDIPLAAAMTGATFFLLRIARNLPRPRTETFVTMRLMPDEEFSSKVTKVSVRADCFSGGIEAIPWEQRKPYDEFDYGYVLTVHKSQGSQWDDVVLFDESFAFQDSRARWLYTGITRAAKKLSIVI